MTLINSRNKSSWSTNKINYGLTAEIDNEKKKEKTVTSQTSTAVSKQPSVWAPRLFYVWILSN